MLYRVLLNLSVLRLVAESPTFQLVKTSTKKRGEEGKKAYAEFQRFEQLVDRKAGEFRVRLLGGTSVLEPFSIALHYGEGDSTPLSHVLPVFQHLYDFAQDLDCSDAITEFLTEEDDRDAVQERMRRRWLGEGRLVGLKADVHLLALVLDPFVHGALTSTEAPTCDLLAGEVLEGARAALRHFSSNDHAARSVLLQQFMLWNAAAPQPGPGGSGDAPPVAVATGHNAFSALRLNAMQQSWAKVKAREEALEKDGTARDEDSPAFAMREAIAKLRLCSSPVDFWLAMMNEMPRGAKPEQKEAHLLFCKTAADISSIIGHTCGVERAGKAYKQVLTSLRKSMEEARAMKAVYVYANYGLLELKHKAGDAFGAFSSDDPSLQQDGSKSTGSGIGLPASRSKRCFRNSSTPVSSSRSCLLLPTARGSGHGTACCAGGSAPAVVGGGGGGEGGGGEGGGPPIWGQSGTSPSVFS